jgi:hypothetical protein
MNSIILDLILRAFEKHSFKDHQAGNIGRQPDLQSIIWADICFIDLHKRLSASAFK